MSVVLSSLTKYVDENRLPLISKLGLDSTTSKEFELQTGVKYESALNLIDVDATFQDGTACGWADSGSTTFTQRKLKVGSIKVQTEICQNAMQEYWMNSQVAISAQRKNLPFEQEICQKVVDNVNSKIEKALWQGDTSSANDNLKYFDGLVKILNATSGATGGVIVATASTSATAIEKVKAVIKAMPDAVVEKSTIYVNYGFFRDLVGEMMDKNYFHYTGELNDKWEMKFGAYNVRIKAVEGLAGVDKIISLVPSHTFYGCDLANDAEQFKCFYDESDDKYKIRVAFTAGVQVAFPSECVQLAY